MCAGGQLTRAVCTPAVNPSPPAIAVSSATKTSRRPRAIDIASVGGAPTPVHNRYLPALVLLFIGSGCAALIYEIVWFQLLSLVVGSSAVSMGVLLGTFMGGMCIGSLFLSKYISRQQHPLRVYAMLEAAIAVFGLLVLWGMPSAPQAGAPAAAPRTAPATTAGCISPSRCMA